MLKTEVKPGMDLKATCAPPSLKGREDKDFQRFGGVDRTFTVWRRATE